MNESALQELAGQLFQAKRAEAEAKIERVEIEEQIAALVETNDNGSKTVDTGNGLKVTVKRGLSYSADLDSIMGLDIPGETMPVKVQAAKYVFNPKEYERVLADHPDVGAKLAEFVTTKPLKASVTIKMA